MPRRPTVQQTAQRVPMIEHRLERLVERLQQAADLMKLMQDRLTLAEQDIVRMRNRIVVIEGKLP